MTMSTAGSNSEIVLALAEEFLERHRKGERPPLQEYIDRHPELAAEIKEVFPAMAMMENIALADESLEAGKGAAGPRPVESLLEQVGDYRIIREVGRGGMGVVYEAEQVSLGRHVALKLLPQKALLDAKQKRRFQREARAAARLHHTNIVPIFAVGQHDGLPYYVMQFIQGLGLDQVMDELKRMGPKGGSPSGGELRVTPRDTAAAEVARSLLSGQFKAPPGKLDSSDSGEPGAPPLRGPAPGETTVAPGNPGPPGAGAPGSPGRLSDSFTLSSSSATLPGQSGDAASSHVRKQTYWQSVAQIGVHVADALEYAHKQGILHRDIKPSNLLLDTRGTTWVTDFGLAKADDQQNITHTGDILGTLRYMPPEAFEGKTDPRSDVYSLGLTLYELLALRPAFDEQDRNMLIKQVMGTEPPRLDRLNPAIPRDLATVVHKAVDREPGRRYATAAELAADLQRFLADEPIQARRLSPRERLWRWCRRNPAVAGLTAAVALLLVGMTVAALTFAAVLDSGSRQLEASLKVTSEARKEAEKSLREADGQRKLAQANFKRAQAMMTELAASRFQIAHHAGKQGKTDEAIRGLKDSVALYEQLIEGDPNNGAYRRGLAEAALDLGELHWQLGSQGVRTELGGRLLDAARAWAKSLNSLHTALRLDPTDAGARQQLNVALPAIAVSYARMGLWEEAARHYREWIGLPGRRGAPDERQAVEMALTAAAADDADLYQNARALFQPLTDDLLNHEDANVWHVMHLVWSWGVRQSPGLPAGAAGWAKKAIPRVVDRDTFGWPHFVLAMIHYRAGEWQPAIAAGEESLRRPWNSQVMNYPVLAMAYKRLGKADKANHWLDKARAEWARLSPLRRSITSPTVLPSAQPKSQWSQWWHDWVAFDLLCREATQLITGSPPVEQALDELHRGYLWARLGQPQKAEVLFARAVKARPDDFEVWFARSRLFTALGMHDRAEADAAKPTRLRPEAPQAWIGYGHSLTERGKHTQADATFAKAAELAPHLHTFLEGGWWVVGPYPVELRLTTALEKAADPSEPPPASKKGDPTWRFIAPDEAGRVDLRAIYDADNISVYALNYLYAPRDRTATLLIDSDDRSRLWVNGKLTHEAGAGYVIRRVERVPISLRAGRNTLLVKVNNFTGAHDFTVRVADNLLDQTRTCAALGLWKETAELWHRHRTIPEEPTEAFRFAYACLQSNDDAGYRQVCQAMLDRWLAGNDAHQLHWTAQACVLAPKAVSDPRRPIEAAEKARQRYPGPHARLRLAHAAAHLRNGQLDEAIRLCELGRDARTGTATDFAVECLLMALAQCGKGDLPNARNWWHQAQDWIATEKAPPGPSVPHSPSPGAWENWLTAQALRKEAAKKLGEAAEDLAAKVEQARRSEVQKLLDKATYDYDLALLLQPDEPRLLLARSRRLADLNRIKESEADRQRFFALWPGNFSFWVGQAQHCGGLGDWKLAGDCYARAEAARVGFGDPGVAAQGNSGGVGFELACVALLAGQQERYRHWCRELPALHEKGFPKPRAYFVARAITLADHPAAEVAKAEKLAAGELKVSRAPGALLEEGALAYRAGRYKEAQERFQTCRQTYHWPGEVVNHLWLALVSHKLGEDKEARRWLGEADNWLAQYPTGMPLSPLAGGIGAMDLHDWLEAHVLRREAARLITAGRPAPKKK
jgi:serine/threonine protein kinase/Tfp pilus assembly protein PilF